jgi:O-antigen ligase
MNLIAVAIALITLFLFILFFTRPNYIIALYAITRPIIQPFIFLHHKLYFLPYSVLWAVILPITLVVNYFLKSWRLVFYNSLSFILILLLAVLSIPYSIDYQASVDGLMKLLVDFSAFCIAYNSVKTYKDVDKIIVSITLSSIVPLLFGFYQSITGQYDQIFSRVGAIDRVSSLFGVGNAYGIYLSITMCAALIMLLRKDLSSKVRMFYIAMFSLMVASQVLALNRGTWIAFSLAATFSVFVFHKNIRIRWFVLGALVIMLAFSSTIYKRFTEEGTKWTGEEKDTFQDRIDTWANLVPLIYKRPLLGYGVGTTGSTEEQNGIQQPHNDYVKLAMDLGLPGVIVYIYFLMTLSLFYLKRRRGRFDRIIHYNFPMAVLTCYMIIISTTQNIIFNMTNFVFFLILNGAVIKINYIHLSMESSRRSLTGNT